MKFFNFLLVPKIILKNRELLWQLVKRNIQSRYRGSLLGFCWSLIQPLLMLCVYTFVFGVVFKVRWGMAAGNDQTSSFAIIMFAGMSVFNIFSESINSCCQAVIANPNYVKKVVFPLEILPVVQIVSSFLLGLIWFVLLLTGTLIIFGSLHWTVFLLPVTLLPLLLLTLGIGWWVASLGVYLRDIQYVAGIIIQILFFMTPIFYPISAVPEKYQWPLRLNPLTMIVEETRNILLFGKLPNWSVIAILLLTGIAVVQLGFIWFSKTKKGFADVL